MLKFFATTEIRKNNNPKNRVIIVGKLLTYTTVILLFAILLNYATRCASRSY